MELEKYFINSLIVNPDSIRSVKVMISPSQLIGDDYQAIYQKILDLDETGDDIDRFSLLTWGKIPNQRLEKIFQIDMEGIILDAERFARFIMKRNLESEFVKAAEEKDPQAGKEVVEGLLNVERGPSYKAIKNIDLTDMRGEIFETGFRFDTYLRLRQTDLCILAGRPGIGKSTLGMNILQHISGTTPVGLISFEMGERGIGRRLSLNMTWPEISARPYFVSFPYSFNLSMVRRVSRDMIDREGIKVIMVDYLQLMSETKRFSSRHLEISYIVRQLKEIAKEFNILMIIVSSLGRSEGRIETSRPILSQLKESGDIEYAADSVIFIHRKSDEERETEVIIAKNRYGKKGITTLIFEPERGRYLNAEQNI